LVKIVVDLRRWAIWAWPNILSRTSLIATIKPTGTG